MPARPEVDHGVCRSRIVVQPSEVDAVPAFRVNPTPPAG